MKRIRNSFGEGLDKPYYLGCRDFQKYNLKSKRWRGLIQIPDDAWLAKKKEERELDQPKKREMKPYRTLEQDLLECFSKRDIKVETIIVQKNLYKIRVKRNG